MDFITTIGIGDSGWTFTTTMHDIEIWKLFPESGGVAAVKGIGTINRPTHEIADIIIDSSRKMEMDTLLAETRDLETPNLQMRVMYNAYKSVWPTSPRDFCYITFYQHDGTGTYILVGRSCEHPDCPERKGYVRADLQHSGWILEPADDKNTSTKATYIVQIDLKGTIPTRIMNQASTKQPLCIYELRKMMGVDK
eukprot:GFYU01019844.1.p1 GENE.GFYU01019844.1~~GFYU01019844.1.p1  ORF type:complete len:195 (-),score=21.19 GFYU01019844.1:51-635(-)